MSSPVSLATLPKPIQDNYGEFIAHFTTGEQQTSSEPLSITIAEMVDLQKKLIAQVASATPSSRTPAQITTLLKSAFCGDTITADQGKALLNDLDTKMAAMKAKQSKMSGSRSHTSASGGLSGGFSYWLSQFFSSPVSTSSVGRTTHSDFPDVIGFENAGANCWMNSLMQMIIAEPSLLAAYRYVAEHYHDHGETAAEKAHGQALLGVLDAHRDQLARQKSVPSEYTQQIRQFFHHFWPNVINDSMSRHEDANEALMLLLGRYERLLQKNSSLPQVFPAGHPLAGSNNPDFYAICPPFYTSTTIKRLYTPIRVPYPAGIGHVYEPINKERSSSVTVNDCRIQIDLQDKTHLSFPALLKQTFRNKQRDDDKDSVERRLPSGQVQRFIRTGEHIEFANHPNELILTLGRFATDSSRKRVKITNPVSVPRTLVLPNEATASGTPLNYELTSFVVHSGGLLSGHYTSYRKIADQWYHLNDGTASLAYKIDVDRALQNSYIHYYRLQDIATEAEVLASRLGQPPSAPIVSSTHLELSKLESSVANRETGLIEWKKFAALVKDPSTDPALLRQQYDLLQKLSSDLINKLHYMLWINGKMPHKAGFGKETCEADLGKLREITAPWVFALGDNVIEQLCAFEEQNVAAAKEQCKALQLRFVLELLKDSKVEDRTIKEEIAKLPIEMQWQIHGLIYKSHLIKYGTKVNVPEYGRTALNDKTREVLLGATEPVLNSHGNILEQMRQEAEMNSEKASFACQAAQLQAFHALLSTREEAVSTAQLNEIFKALELPQALKTRFHSILWDNRASLLNPGVPFTDSDFGGKVFRNNPRILLTLNTAVALLNKSAS